MPPDDTTPRETLTALLEDRDWVAPPSARREIAQALTDDSQAPAERIVSALEPEIAAWKAFCLYRDRLDRRRAGDAAREQRLYALRRKLRARLQSRRFS